MTAGGEAAEAIATTQYAAARDHLQQAVLCAGDADLALSRAGRPYKALDSLRDARRHLDRAEAAIRVGTAAAARRDAEQ